MKYKMLTRRNNIRFPVTEICDWLYITGESFYLVMTEVDEHLMHVWICMYICISYLNGTIWNLMSAHSTFIFSRFFSKLCSLEAASLISSNLFKYSPRFMSIIFCKVSSGDGRIGNPTISEIFSQWRSRSPGFPSVWMIGSRSLKMSINPFIW